MMHAEMAKLLYEEKRMYLGDQEKSMTKKYHKRYVIWKYLDCFRRFQYYREMRNNEKNRILRCLCKFLCKYFDKRKNIWSEKAGIEIGSNCRIGKNLDIWHSGVVINANIGEGCIFHGNNILGNKGNGRENETPLIGNNVDFGAGCVVIGDIEIADGCVIGANAVVTKSVKTPNSIIVGVPGIVVKD